jgi:hypothetical protein
MRNDRMKTIAALSLPLATIVTVTSSVGLFTTGFYSNEAANWEAQAIGQDAIDLFLVTPVLLVTCILTFFKNKNGFSLWAGANLYFVYTYVIYCFDVRLNSLFVLYCLALGISFYSVLYFLFSQTDKSFHTGFCSKIVVKIIAIYFLIVSGFFYFLWLSEIIPAIRSHEMPESLIASGLPTNPVHVLDLSVVLPGIFIVGVLILKKHPLGLSLLPALLLFFILMDITIGSLAIFMQRRGLATAIPVAIVMAVLALFSAAMLAWYLKTARSFRGTESLW